MPRGGLQADGPVGVLDQTVGLEGPAGLRSCFLHLCCSVEDRKEGNVNLSSLFKKIELVWFGCKN